MTALFDQLRTAPRAVLNRLGDDEETRRPLPVSGMLAAVWTLGVGLAVLTTLTLIGWMAAPRGAFGEGLPGVFRAACQLWLAAHHAGFAIPGGRIGLLPLGLMILPGALLYRAGLWMARDADLRLRMPARLPKGTPRDVENARRRAQLVLVAQAGISLAAPYALLAGVIALVARNEVTQPFLGEALVSHFALAFLTGSVATARTIGPWRSMLRLLPERPRSLVAGTAVALTLQLAAAAVLVVVAIVMNFGEIHARSEMLSPGFVGGLLLLLLEGLYLFNAVIWGLAYIAGPGFAIGTGTLIAPTGVKLSVVPTLPLLGALPTPGTAPAWVMAVIAVPFAAGAVAGVVMARVAPTPMIEAAPLWGFVCGLSTGAMAGVLAALSGGPLGGGRLSAVGPSPWEVALSVTLEVGVAAGISAGLANWWLISRRPVAAPEPVRKAGAVITKAARRVRPHDRGARVLPGHWLDATEADTQPIPVIKDDWPDEHAAAAAATFGRRRDNRKDGRKDSQRDGRKDGRKNDRKDDRRDDRRDGRRDGRKDDPRADREDDREHDRKGIVDESDDRGGHVIYMDPYAWDRD
ncbi:cell division protein PerM [Sphaerimonospora mesophila]|uniref:cell division protein PerM n=1 Tax=Sphaerimonospora mesophila TaxID=37483 RepID=UPI0006E31E36